MKILDHKVIQHKIKRLAIEILERNFGEKEIVLAGMNNNGLGFANLLLPELQKRAPESMTITLTRIRLNPKNPLDYPPHFEMDLKKLNKKNIIIVDDVANTGRTIFYAIQPLLGVLPKKVEVAVLVDRKHKLFPIKADYVGLALATTLKNDIDVDIENGKDMAVYLN